MPNVEAHRVAASPAAGEQVGRPQPDGSVLVDASNPWLLDQADACWLVEAGRVDLFAIVADASGRPGRRVYLRSIEAGQSLGGQQSTADGLASVLAVAIPDTVIRGCDPACVTPLVSPTGQPLGAWVDELQDTRDSDETLRLQALGDNDLHVLDRAEALLAGVTQRQRSTAASDDDVVVALTALAAKEGMRAPTDPKHPLSGDLMDRVQAVTGSMDARARRVRLVAGWWATPGDGFIGADESGRAVAVLPRKRGLLRRGAGPLPYAVVRAGTPEPMPLDSDLALGISLDAIAVYKVMAASPRRLRDLVRAARSSVGTEMVWMGFLAIAASLMAMLVPITLGKVVSSAVPNRQEQAVVGLVLMLFAAGVGSFVFDVVRNLTLARLGGEYDRNLLPALWDRLLRLPVQFFRGYDVGDLASRIIGVDQARQVLSDILVVGTLSAATALVNVFLMLYLSVRLAIPSLVVIALFAGISLIMIRLADRHGRLAIEGSGRLQAMSLQLVKGVAKIRVAGATATMFGRWAGVLATTSRSRQAAAIRMSVVGVAAGALALAATAAAYGAAVMLGDEVSISIFAAFATSLGLATSAAASVAMSAATLPTIRVLMDRASPILTTPTEDARVGRRLDLQGSVSFQDLHFGYAGLQTRVLDGFTLDVPAGSFTAVVGASGCGKSTVLRCLMGFERPQRGAVLLDDNDLGELDLTFVRRQLGVVMQQFQVMGGTVFENIIGPRALTEADAWVAAERVGLADFIRSLPMGMRTLIVDGGGTFSGGQAQRLMLARAVASEPRIIVLDEATSALDNPTQELVARSLAELTSTRIVIAHRLSTIRHADQIAVMDRGQIVELGRHDELMALDGTYAALARRQL